MFSYLIKKSISFIATLLCIVSFTFILMKMIPGDPFSQERALPPETMDALMQHYGLSDPYYIQYFRYLKALLCGDLGPSLTYQGQNVNQILADGFPISALLGLQALTFALLLGITLGSIAALYRNRWPDRVAMIWSVFGLSVPSFIIATALQYIFAIKLGWLPIARWGTPLHAVLPALSLSILPSAFIARLMRSSLIEVLHQDYIKMARAKGLSERAIFLRHALKNALLPVISYFGPMAANVLTGTFVVERVFSIPGIGQWLITSINNRDYPVILGITVFYSSILLSAVFLVDLCYLALDPRMRADINKR